MPEGKNCIQKVDPLRLHVIKLSLFFSPHLYPLLKARRSSELNLMTCACYLPTETKAHRWRKISASRAFVLAEHGQVVHQFIKGVVCDAFDCIAGSAAHSV